LKLEEDVAMFKIIGGTVVYGFALYGLFRFLGKRDEGAES
jgi:hypothetical protein